MDGVIPEVENSAMAIRKAAVGSASNSRVEFLGGDAFADPYMLLGARLSWRNIADNGVDLTVCGGNLTDTCFVTGGSTITLRGFENHDFGQPRTFGFTLKYSYNWETISRSCRAQSLAGLFLPRIAMIAV